MRLLIISERVLFSVSRGFFLFGFFWVWLLLEIQKSPAAMRLGFRFVALVVSAVVVVVVVCGMCFIFIS